MKSKELYIFLDIDGVLNKKSDWACKYYIDENCVKVLGAIVSLVSKKYTPRIVLSSTWRAGMGSNSDSGPIADLKEKLAVYDLSIFDATPTSTKSRQEEIEYYVRKNNIEHFLVIDDDESLFIDTKKLPFLKVNLSQYGYLSPIGV